MNVEVVKNEKPKVTTINGYECPKIEMPIDKDILTKYKWNIDEIYDKGSCENILC